MSNIRFVLYILISIILLGCELQKPTVAFLLPNLNSKRYIIERDVFAEKIKELGGQTLFASANNDEILQIKQFEEILDQKPKVIVLDPVNRFTAAVMVRLARKSNIKVISYDRLIVGCAPDAFLSFDAKKIGNQIAENALIKKKSGEYVILNGDKSDINAEWIHDGIMDVLNPYIQQGNIRIVMNMFVEGWNEAEAKYIMDKFLRYNVNVPVAILVSSDLMARGVIHMLKKYQVNPNQIFISGQNAEVFACKALLRGEQTITIYKPVKELAITAAILAMKYQQNTPVNDILTNTVNNGYAEIPCRFFESIVIDSSKVYSVLIKEGFISEQELVD